jgi:hypothetical protein
VVFWAGAERYGSVTDLDLRTSGRAAKPVEAHFVRELVESDLLLLQTEKGVTAPAVKSLRDRHHHLARVLATGAKPAEASLITGYSLSRISILQADPAFIELLAFYRESENVVKDHAFERMGMIHSAVSAEILDRLETEPEEIGFGQLVETMKVTADRIGHAPAAKSVNVNVNFDLAGRLAAARKRAFEAIEGPIIEGEFTEAAE